MNPIDQLTQKEKKTEEVKKPQGDVNALKPDEEKKSDSSSGKQIEKPTFVPSSTPRLRPEGSSGRGKKKRHCCLILIIILVVIIVAGLIGVSATGLYKIPVLSSVFNVNKPKDLGIKTSAEALNSIKKKVPMTISGEPISYTESSSQIFSGEIPVDTQLTSEELTSWLNRFQGTDPAVSEVQVKKIEGGLEFSGILQKYIKTPIYAKVMINRASEKSISINLQKAKIGIFNVPEKYLKEVEKFLQERANERMASIPGFSMDTLEYHDGYSILKGTFPANVRPTTAGWSGLFKVAK